MKFNDEHIKPLIESLQNGDGRVRACKAAGIHYSTFLNWLNDPDKSDFSERVKKAEQTGNDRIKDLCLRKIIENKSWQSSAWILERRFPDEFRLRTEVREDRPINVHIDKQDTKL